MEIDQLLIFEGPNRYDRRPGVLARIRADRDRSRALRNQLKDAAQRIGLVIGNPGVDLHATGGTILHELFFVTPMPAIGAGAVRYVVALLNAHDAGDDEWDSDGSLWDLQKRRRAESLPLHALQLIAEASARGIPSFVRADGRLQLGYGARGQAFDIAPLRERGPVLNEGDIGIGAPPFARPTGETVPHWQHLGALPIIAVTGGMSHGPALMLFTERLLTRVSGCVAVQDAAFDDVRAVLADPAARMATFALNPLDLLHRGLPFNRCTVSALVDLPDALVAMAGSRAELARALGVALLVTEPDGRIVLNADDPAILALAAYAPCPMIMIARSEINPALSRHRAGGDGVAFMRDRAIVVAQGATETVIEPCAADDPMAVLAAVALSQAFETVMNARERDIHP